MWHHCVPWDCLKQPFCQKLLFTQRHWQKGRCLCAKLFLCSICWLNVLPKGFGITFLLHSNKCWGRHFCNLALRMVTPTRGEDHQDFDLLELMSLSFSFSPNWQHRTHWPDSPWKITYYNLNCNGNTSKCWPNSFSSQYYLVWQSNCTKQIKPKAGICTSTFTLAVYTTQSRGFISETVRLPPFFWQAQNFLSVPKWATWELERDVL